MPTFEKMDEKVLEAMSGHLKRVTYTEDSYIIREGEPLEKMLFITQGTAWSYPTSNTNHGSTIDYSIIKCLEKGDFYGNELLSWALKFGLSSEFPISTRVVKSQTKVEAFAIRAKDLKRVVHEFWWIFKSKLGHLHDVELEEHWEHLAACSLQARQRHRYAMNRNPELQKWRKLYFKVKEVKSR